jgi:hypothetical protein
MPNNNIILKKLDRQRWSDFPLETKVHGCNGGYYLRVEGGWKWWGAGDTVPRPSADWRHIELPFTQEEVDQSVRDLFGVNGFEDGLPNCKHEKEIEDDSGNSCKHCRAWN